MVKCHVVLDKLFPFGNFLAPYIEFSLQHIVLSLISGTLIFIFKFLSSIKYFAEKLRLLCFWYPSFFEKFNECIFTLKLFYSGFFKLVGIKTH